MIFLILFMNFYNDCRQHVYVSTLDGKLSALDVLDNGNLKWSINTGPGSLLSSSIHRMEVISFFFIHSLIQIIHHCDTKTLIDCYVYKNNH